MSNCQITGLTIGYYVATFIIAAVAVGSLWFNIRSNRKTAEVLNKVKEAFAAYVEPLVVFTSYQWINDKRDVPFSHDNIPKGIMSRMFLYKY